MEEAEEGGESGGVLCGGSETRSGSTWGTPSEDDTNGVATGEYGAENWKPRGEWACGFGTGSDVEEAGAAAGRDAGGDDAEGGVEAAEVGVNDGMATTASWQVWHFQAKTASGSVGARLLRKP